MVAIYDDNEISCVGGKYENGYVTTELRSFGKYAVAIDSIAPTIKALNIQSGKELNGQSSIRFHVEDELSGIASYRAFIDNDWILMQFDPKNDLLFYIFDDERISSMKNHEFELYVEDSKGNTSFYHTSFFR